MAAIDEVKLRVPHPETQTLGIAPGNIGRIILVLAARDVQHRSWNGAVAAFLPIAGQSAAEANHAAHRQRAGGGEPVVQRHRLRKAEQQPALFRIPTFPPRI